MRFNEPNYFLARNNRVQWLCAASKDSCLRGCHVSYLCASNTKLICQVYLSTHREGLGWWIHCCLSRHNYSTAQPCINKREQQVYLLKYWGVILNLHELMLYPLYSATQQAGHKTPSSYPLVKPILWTSLQTRAYLQITWWISGHYLLSFYFSFGLHQLIWELSDFLPPNAQLCSPAVG